MNIAEFNYIESVLWLLISIALCMAAVKNGRRHPDFKVTIVGCIGFLVFSISDVIEAKTGAWWKPLWLLLMKLACIATFVGCYFKYKKVRKGNA